MARKKDTPQKAALREMMGNYLKENNVKVSWKVPWIRRWMKNMDHNSIKNQRKEVSSSHAPRSSSKYIFTQITSNGRYSTDSCYLIYCI